ncbi:MAG: hypothetical protein HWE30_08260 [Methylocystaceae bacterium]|nr:hypothetical protein [Methylocystaceae bacterium]
MVDTNYTQVALSPQEMAPEKNKNNSEEDFSFFGDDGMSFWDFVDMINPLQHIPVVSTAYREMTGDEIDPGSRLAGGTLYGGPLGLAASTFNVILEHNTGKDVGEHVVAWFDGDEVPAEEQPVYAQNETGQSTSAFAAGFAPQVPDSEADAFAAGEASLRLAAIQEFMNPAIAKEVPVTAQPVSNFSPNKGAGSAGTWAAPDNLPPPFPTERAGTVPSTPQAMAQPINTPATEEVTKPEQYTGFQAQQTHEESIDALRAFARDVQAQRLQSQTQDVQQQQQQPAPAPVPTTTSQLNQTTDNAWFADMMSRNMNRYSPTGPKG